MSSESRTISCLIAGRRIKLIMKLDDDLSDMKALLRADGLTVQERSGITSAHIILWKLRNPVAVEPFDSIGTRIPAFGNDRYEKLVGEAIKVGTIFPEQPPKDYMHIVAQLPGTAMMRILSDPVAGYEEIEGKIKMKLEALRQVIRTFLQNPELPAWVPPAWVTDPTIRNFLVNLQIPASQDGSPNLLFHHLHFQDSKQVNEILDCSTDVFICNTSGSGKTRRILECLTKSWGFYFVAGLDELGVGIGDFSSAIDSLRTVSEPHEDPREWVPDLSKLETDAARNNQDSVNRGTARRVLKKIFAARIVLFELFLELAIEVDGGLQEKHKRLWLFLQSFNHVSSAMHPVHEILECFAGATPSALDTIIMHLANIRHTLNSHHPVHKAGFVVVLDEAQQALRSFPRAFLSAQQGKKTSKYRSLFREAVVVFGNPRIDKLIVSGTGLSLHEMKDSMSSVGVAKSHVEMVRPFHTLGMFHSWDLLELFLQRYIPQSIWTSSSGLHLQRRIQEYLLGRYRFAVTFMQLLLQNGLESPHKLLNQYLAQYHCYPQNTGLPYTLVEAEVRIDFQIGPFEWESLNDDAIAFQQVKDVAHSHLTRKQAPIFGPVTPLLVEYGIAHLRKYPNNVGHQGAIVEPLAFVSLLQWLQKKKGCSIQDTIASAVGRSALRGSACEEGIILYLLRTMRTPVTLSSIFQFHGTPPRWANDKLQLVGRLDGIDVAVSVLDAPQNPSLGVTHYAESIEDVLSWIASPTRAAILIPSDSFGPDLLFFLGDILVMGQIKSYLSGNENTLNAATVAKALCSLHPDHWFKSLTSREGQDRRKTLLDAINKYTILRFIAAFPLPADLDLKAKSVKGALDAFEPGTALATLSVDALRLSFVDEEARNYLIPMEYALECKRNSKRKADEMEL